MAISLSSTDMESSVLRGPWPGNRHATLRRGSHERKIVAGYAKSAYPITGKSCATRSVMFLNQNGRAPMSTHPAHAHKHAASQTVPRKHQAAMEKTRTRRR